MTLHALSKDPLLCIEDLLKFQKPVPRYTSYPPVTSWTSLDEKPYEDLLKERGGEKSSALSVYIHVPFCKTMCLFCGCHVILNRQLEKRLHYADLVELEIAKLGRSVSNVPISHLHLGGGTPTYMPLESLQRWVDLLKKTQGFIEGAELSIEVDPRTVMESEGQMLHDLKTIGFNRLSFGLQDVNEEVQEAIRRRQSAQMSEKTLIWAKEAGFDSVNVDLIYGLPRQTTESFAATISKVCFWRPSRVALFSYANVPWLKAHQKAIADELPAPEEKLRLYLIARDLFLKEGYVQIGMDHFALPSDEMAKAYEAKRLQRDFQGYSLDRESFCSKDQIGLGVSATGFMKGLYVQNVKEIEVYEAMLKEDRWPLYRGKSLSSDDCRRHWVIQRIMCDFSLVFDQYQEQFSRDFKQDFAREIEELKKDSYLELVTLSQEGIESTPLGRIFIRLVASAFDAYLQESSKQRFSMSI